MEDHVKEIAGEASPGWAVIACYRDLASWLDIMANNPDMLDDTGQVTNYASVAVAYRMAADVINPDVDYISPQVNVWLPVDGGPGVKTDLGIFEMID